MSQVVISSYLYNKPSYSRILIGSCLWSIRGQTHDWRHHQLLCKLSLILYYIKQIDSMLPWVCSVIDHRRRQNVVRTSVTHSAVASCATFLFLPHFDVICDLLLNRRTATWNLFVKHKKQIMYKKKQRIKIQFHLPFFCHWCLTRLKISNKPKCWPEGISSHTSIFL